MITIVSIICTILGLISGFIITFYLSKSVILSIIIGIIAFVVILALFSLYMIITLINWNKKKNIDDKVISSAYAFMHDLSHFVLFWLGIKIHIKGLEKLDVNKKYIFYSNHQGFIDIFLNDYVLKKYNFASMYKIEHDSNILFSGIIKILGGVAIDRSNDRQAVKGILEIINKVKNGQNYMIYPEGTRSHSKKLNEYHAGSFKVFQKTESSLVVIAIDGADKKGCFIPLIPTHLYFEIVDVFDSDEMRKMPTVELAAEVKNITEKALHDARKDNWFLKE